MGAIHLNNILFAPTDNLGPEQKDLLKKRAQSLGMSYLINSDTGKITVPVELEQPNISATLLRKAKQLKKPTLIVTEKKAREALAFLELFAVYADNGADLSLLAMMKWSQNDLDNKVERVISGLLLMEVELDYTKSGLKPTLNNVKRGIDKLITVLPLIEKKALGKSVAKAVNILRRYIA